MPEHGSEYGYLSFHLVHKDEVNECPQALEDDDPLRHLVVQASYPTVKSAFTEDDDRCKPRYWDVSFRDIHRLDLEMAERMLKPLRRLSTTLKALDDKYGRAPDYPSYVIRVGRALGVKGVFLPTEDNGHFKDGHWAQFKLVEVDFLVARAMQKARARYVQEGRSS